MAEEEEAGEGEDSYEIIVDNGTGLMKAGFSGDDTPFTVVSNLVGRPKSRKIAREIVIKALKQSGCSGASAADDFAAMVPADFEALDISDGDKESMLAVHGQMFEYLVGEEASAHLGQLKLSYPIQHGVVENWADMEKIWDHLYNNELRITPEEHMVMLTEAALNPKANRERTAQMHFETFGFAGIQLATQAVLSLYASGRTTGIVMDSGAGVTHTVPVYEGYAIPHAVKRLDLAGRDLTQWMMRLLMRRGYRFTTSAEVEIVRDMKEQLCYVPLDYSAEVTRAAASCSAASRARRNARKKGGASGAAAAPVDTFLRSYELPDGKEVQVGAPRFQCPEALFKPEMLGKELEGIAQCVFKSIMTCDIDVRSELEENIVISGGSTMFTGFPERLDQEITHLVPPTMARAVQVIAPADRAMSVWIGGAILGRMDDDASKGLWISKEEYEETGPSVVHRSVISNT